MSENVLKIFGIALICLMMSLLFKRMGSDMGTLIKIISAVFLSGICIYMISPIISFVYELSATDALSVISPSVGVLLRALAVAFVTHICASVCRDCGEGTLASYVEMGGKIEIMVLSLPLITEIVRIVGELLDT